MKPVFALLIASFFALNVNAQTTNTPDPNKKTQVVEASCGTCKFGMKADDCSLAVKIDGKTYFVDGTKIDDHGDAHAKDGFCNAIRKAEVQGEVVDNRFKVTYFKLLALPEDKPQGKTN